MSQTLVLDTPVTQIANPTSSQVHDQEREVSKRRLPPEANRSVGRGSILAAILSTLLLRIASRTSFVLLGFYLGEHFTSATCLRRTTVMFIGLCGLSVSIFGLTLINGLAGNPAHVPDSSKPLLLLLLSLVMLGVLLLSGFTPASLTHMAAISELLPDKRGAVMGLYSVIMGVGQLIGASLGGLCVDLGGFYGLMGFSVAMGLVSLGSVLYIRVHGHDLITSQSSYRWSASGKLPSHACSKKAARIAARTGF